MSMISGAHFIVPSRDVEADRAFFRDVLGFVSVDAGHGWLIFALPPAEAAFHPAAADGRDLDRACLYLMCDDLAAVIAKLQEYGVACEAVTQERWGSVTNIVLPSGARLGLYQPRHPTALDLNRP